MDVAADDGTLVLHDLRRSCRTNVLALGIEDLVCELVIGHTLPSLHSVYDQHSHLPQKRPALEAWESKLLSIVELDKASPSNVVQLSRKKQKRA